MATPIDVAVFIKRRKTFLTGNRRNRASFTEQKNKISAPSQTVATARSRPKSAWGSPKHWLTFFQISSKSVHFRQSYSRTLEGRSFAS